MYFVFVLVSSTRICELRVAVLSEKCEVRRYEGKTHVIMQLGNNSAESVDLAI